MRRKLVDVLEHLEEMLEIVVVPSRLRIPDDHLVSRADVVADVVQPTTAEVGPKLLVRDPVRHGSIMAARIPARECGRPT
jgi:hypothetical protein